jgi:hypothetical protein
VSAARIYGKNLVFAESFTGGGWEDHPYALKALGDHNFAQGINHFFLHLWNEQYLGRAPGVPGPGTPFHYLNTWWTAGQPWRDYLQRCEAVLQAGTPVGDILYFTGEDIPNRSLTPYEYGSYYRMEPTPPKGYTCNSINRDGLLTAATVDRGEIVLKSGTRYRVLVLPSSSYMSLEVLQKVASFVRAGVSVVGPAPTKSPQLQEKDSQVQLESLAAETWKAMKAGDTLDAALARIELAPDFNWRNAVDAQTGTPLKFDASEVRGVNPTLDGLDRQGWGFEFIHRRTEEHDIYFVSNQETKTLTADLIFRNSTGAPLLWSAERAEMREAPVWRDEHGRSLVSLTFQPAESVFVLFPRRPRLEKQHLVSLSAAAGASVDALDLQISATGFEAWSTQAGRWEGVTAGSRKVAFETSSTATVALEGDWNVTFPVGGQSKVRRLKAGSWTGSSEDEIKYFSGTATYVKEFRWNRTRDGNTRWVLDLGDVAYLVKVQLNGTDLGILWKPPFSIDVTAALQSGTNRLRLEVTNTWLNRLIGNASDPRSTPVTEEVQTGFSRGTDRTTPLQPAGLIGPVILRQKVKAKVRTGGAYENELRPDK